MQRERERESVCVCGAFSVSLKNNTDVVYSSTNNFAAEHESKCNFNFRTIYRKIKAIPFTRDSLRCSNFLSFMVPEGSVRLQ
jgi:hypothetical protein